MPVQINKDNQGCYARWGQKGAKYYYTCGDKGQEMAQNFINEGKDVYIITRRQKMFSSAVYDIAKKLSIPRENVYFTNGKMKWETIKRLGIGKHYDNNQREVDYINQYTDAEGILFQ